jgi:hypothetical protein
MAMTEHEIVTDRREADFLLSLAAERKAQYDRAFALGKRVGRQIERDIKSHNSWLERIIVFLFGLMTGAAVGLEITARILGR